MFGSSRNGNYLGVLESIGKSDSFLVEHISHYGNKGRGTASYLSSTICNELIEQMGEDVLPTTYDEVHEAKHLSMCIVSTPHVSDINQLNFTVRYINKGGCTGERFLKFLSILCHSGESLQ